MRNSDRPLKRSPLLGATRRRSLAMDGTDLVTTAALHACSALPLVVRPAVEGVDLTAWIDKNRTVLDGFLATHGGVLFRGFHVGGLEGLERFSQVMSGGILLEYVYRSTPRKRVGDTHIYTSTEYPSDQSIPLHNENAYAGRWPIKIWFFACVCAETGGETPIADSRNVYRRLDPAVREQFSAKQVMYVRNYGDLDLPWQVAFQTEDAATVTSYCCEAGIDMEWKEGGRLRTRQVLPAVAVHPRTREPVWFNQAHLFHISALDSAVRESLLRALPEADLPRNAYYGDGSPIASEALEAIRAVYQEETITFRWEPEDILLLDNMLTAHGRNPFTGERRVLVGMAELCSVEVDKDRMRGGMGR